MTGKPHLRRPHRSLYVLSLSIGSWMQHSGHSPGITTCAVLHTPTTTTTMFSIHITLSFLVDCHFSLPVVHTMVLVGAIDRSRGGR